MTDHPCPYKPCPFIGRSEKTYTKHLVFEHESMPDGTPVKDYTWKSLTEKGDITYFILLKFPETRVPKDGPLHKKILQHIIRATNWNSNTQGVEMNGHMPDQRWEHALDQLDDYGRAKEILQTKDKRLYHEKAPDGTWPMKIEHRCILPSPTQTALGEISQEAHREILSPQTAYYMRD